MSYDVRNFSRELVADDRSTVRVSRLYVASAWPLQRYQSPSYGSYGAAPGVSQSTGAALANCGNSSTGRKLEVDRNAAVWSWFLAEPSALSCAVKPSNRPAVPTSGYGPSSPVPPSSTYVYAPSQYCWKSLNNGRQGGSSAFVH